MSAVEYDLRPRLDRLLWRAPAWLRTRLLPPRDHVELAQDNMRALVKALPAGGYSEPLKVESLDATMRCTTFHDGGYQAAQDAMLMWRLQRYARFFRLRELQESLGRAAVYFESEHERRRLKLRPPSRWDS